MHGIGITELGVILLLVLAVVLGPALRSVAAPVSGPLSHRNFLLVGVVIIAGRISAQQTSTPLQNYQIGVNAFVSDQSDTVYLVLDDALYRRMNDGAAEWDRIATNIRAVSVDPQHANTLYGIDTGNRIVKSLDQGKSWLTLNVSAVSNSRPSCVYVNPANPQEIFVGTETGLIRSTDAGFGWRASSLTQGPVVEVVINPQKPSVQYALVAHTVFVSVD